MKQLDFQKMELWTDIHFYNIHFYHEMGKVFVLYFAVGRKKH